VKTRLVSNRYLIDKDSLENLLKSEKDKVGIDEEQMKNMTRQMTSLSEQGEILIEENTKLKEQLSNMEKENKELYEKISILEKDKEFLKEKLNILEKDKEFLQGQVQNLVNTINLLTTKQLPPPGQGLFTRLKSLFKK
jgi:chromosome segregation ATPase